jgi:hypothetical protein
MRNIVVAAVLGAGIALGAAACGPATSHHVSAAQSAQAKKDAKALAKCLPSGATQQIQLAHSLGTHSGRAALAAKCGVSPAHKAAFEAEALTAAEHGHLTTKAGRAAYFEVTLPGIIERNQG